MTDHTNTAETRASSPTKLPFLAYGLFLGLLGLGQAFVWLIWEPSFGDSLKNLVTYSMGILLLIGSAILALVTLPLSWKKRLLVAGLCVSPLIVIAAVVDDVDWSGDMRMTWHYRWDEPTSAAKRAAASAPVGQTIEPAAAITADDFAEYRGPARDGRVDPADADFSAAPQELWRRDVGAGWAGIAVVGDALFTLEQIGTEEAIVCYDAHSGDELWRYSYAASFDEAMGGPGPRSTPTVNAGYVFACGAQGHLTCVEFATGQLVWQVNTLERFGISNLTWATSGSPLVRGDRVYLNVGSTNDGGLTCFDRETGETIWRASREEWNTTGDNAAGYASPMFGTIAGIEQIIMLDGLALRGHAIEDGRELWSHPFTNDPLVNVAQPILFPDGRIFIAASYDIGCEMVQVERNDTDNAAADNTDTQSTDTDNTDTDNTDTATWSASSLWKQPRLMRCKFTSPVELDGYLYGLDEGILECLDANEGKRMWKKGRYGHGQILLAGDNIVVMAEDGRVVVVKANPEKLSVLSETDVFTDAARNWNPASVSRGRVFARNHEEMARLDFPVSTAAAPASATPEQAVTVDGENIGQQ